MRGSEPLTSITRVARTRHCQLLGHSNYLVPPKGQLFLDLTQGVMRALCSFPLKGVSRTLTLHSVFLTGLQVHAHIFSTLLTAACNTGGRVGRPCSEWGRTLPSLLRRRAVLGRTSQGQSLLDLGRQEGVAGTDPFSSSWAGLGWAGLAPKTKCEASKKGSSERPLSWAWRRLRWVEGPRP